MTRNHTAATAVFSAMLAMSAPVVAGQGDAMRAAYCAKIIDGYVSDPTTPAKVIPGMKATRNRWVIVMAAAPTSEKSLMLTGGRIGAADSAQCGEDIRNTVANECGGIDRQECVEFVREHMSASCRHISTSGCLEGPGASIVAPHYE